MSEVIYRKYRPRKFKEVIGQDHITSVLEEQLRTDNFSHAYLFTGSRGTGKTSVARIFAYEINKANSQETQLDIVEIDAASNRGIDDIRDLRDKITYAPSKSKYKVYIIDEVHMLTKEAFNALLKTLEEPPKHVIFIFATTEPHKIPITILSRVTRFDFRLATHKNLKKKFEYILKKEQIEFDEKVLEVVIKYSNGSYRDGESLLTKIISGITTKKLTVDEVNQIVGLVDSEIINTFIQNLIESNTLELVRLLNNLKGQGKNLDIVISQLVFEFEAILISQLEPKAKRNYIIALPRIISIINELSKAINESKNDILYGLSYELALIRLSMSDTILNSSNFISDPDKQRIMKNEQKDKEVIPKTIEKPNEKAYIKDEDKSGVGSFDLDNLDKSWKDCIKKISEKHFQIAAFLINTKLKKSESGSVIIEVPYSYYKQKFEGRDNKAILEKYLNKGFGQENLEIIVKYNSALQKKDGVLTKKAQSNKDLVEDIFDI